MPELKKYMGRLRGSKQFAVQETTDLNSATPGSWPSGIGGAINNGYWSNLGQDNNGRLCGFIRMLKLLKLMPYDHTTPNPYPPATHPGIPYDPPATPQQAPICNLNVMAAM